jgi:signal transduction histidine kinase/CheY-like chemotaxis protein
VAVICVAFGAFTTIVGLQGRTRAALQAQATLGKFESALHSLQDIPWTLAAPGAPSATVVARQLTAAERGITVQLSEAEHRLPTRALQAVPAQLRRNFSGNRQILALIAEGKIAAAPAANKVATAANDQIVKALDAARQDYGNRAAASLTREAIGFAGVIAALVAGFLFFLRLSTRAREDRFRRTEAERASRAKSEFLSRVSHELRTPLNSILGFAQIVARSDLNERQRGNIERVSRAGRHLLDLINEVLDIARIEAGELRLSLEPVRVGSVANDVIELLTPLADARAIALTANAGCAETWVQADVQRIKQVLLNLVTNAIKYNRDGRHVTVNATRGAEGRVRIVVADDGPGIADEKIDRIFSPFERLGAWETVVEGTGLGLALSKGFVEAMGGTITVESTVGLGSAFTVELAAAEPQSALRSGQRASAPPASAEPGRKVLYIEDNVSNLDLVEEVFADRPDITLLTAVQGKLGIELAREHKPEVVLLDLNLPDISGEIVLERLRGDEATANIPVIVVTADATERQRALVESRGAAAYITKPIDIDELLGAVDETLLAPTGQDA